MTETATQPKTYYSLSAAMQVRISKGERVVNTLGQQELVGEKFASFVPTSGAGQGRVGPLGDYGMLTTEDPEIIAWMDHAIASGRGDIITPAEYNRRTTPPEIRERELQSANAQLMRELQEKNELIARIAAERQAAKERAQQK